MKALLKSCLLVSVFVCAQAQAGNLDGYFSDIQSAVWAGDIKALTKLSGDLGRRAVDGDAESVYLAAYADYRLATLSSNDLDRYQRQTEAALDRAQSRLEVVGEQPGPYQAEALAMLSGVYGMQTYLHPLMGWKWGPKSAAAQARAVQLAPDNPRVLLFKGLNALFTPPMFGGSREQAIAAFDAVAAHLPAKDFSPVNWGLDDAYIWRCAAYPKNADAGIAHSCYDDVLKIAPRNAWAKQLSVKPPQL